MASQLKELSSFLPGGTYITFTVLAQLTTNTTEMIQRLNTSDCICDPKREGEPTSSSCTPRHVCGVGYWELTIALMVLSAVVVFVLAWYGEDLKVEKEIVCNAITHGRKGTGDPQQAGTGTSAGPGADAGNGQPSVPADAAAAADIPATTVITTASVQVIQEGQMEAGGLSAGDADTSPFRDTAAMQATTSGGHLAGSSSAAPLPPLPPAATGAGQSSRYYMKFGSTNTPYLVPEPVIAPDLTPATGTTPPAAAGRSSSSSIALGQLKKQLKKQKDFTIKVSKMTKEQQQRKYYEVVFAQYMRAFGALGIFLVLAILTPPVSTCLLPPCRVPAVVLQVVPMLVSFALSAFLAVQKKLITACVDIIADMVGWLNTARRFIFKYVCCCCPAGGSARTTSLGPEMRQVNSV